MVNYFDNSSLIELIGKYKKHIAIIVGFAIVASFVFSGETFIRPRYKSVMIMYPVNIIPYGDESPAEQMVQVFRSTDIRDAIIKKYDLANKYGINLNKPAAKAKLYGMYDDNINISKTEFESVKIEVWDINPDTAAAIGKDIINFFNEKAKMLSQKTAAEILSAYDKSLDLQMVLIDSMENRLKELRQKYGILDYKAQAKEASKLYLEAITKGNNKGRDEINNVLNNLQQYGGEYTALNEMLAGERKNYYKVKAKRDQYLTDATKVLSYENIVTKLEAPDKKSFPVRWVIVLCSALLAFLLSLFILAVIDYNKRKTTLE